MSNYSLTKESDVGKSLADAKLNDYDNDIDEEMKCVIMPGVGKSFKKATVFRPVPQEGEVLVHVRACGVNFADLSVKAGLHENIPKYPFIGGFECAGEVVKLGLNAENGLQIGDRVICLSKFNTWAEYVAVNVNYVYKIPEKMTFKDAAAISYNYLTAYILLHEFGNIKSGQSVFFHSAGGGVGIALTQLTKLINNLTVIGTCSKNKFGALKHHVKHLYDESGSADYVPEIKKLHPDGIDLVLDCLSGEHTNKGIALLKPMGKYIIYGTAKNLEGESKSKNYFTIAKNWWHVDKISPLKLYDESVTISGFHLHNFIFNNNVTNSRKYLLDIYAKLFSLYIEGKIKPVIDSIHSFDNIADALAQLQERKNVGKVILDPYFDSQDSHLKTEKDRRNSTDTSGPDDSDEPDEPAVGDELL